MNLLSSHLPVLSPGEAVPELWVCELVKPTGSCDAEVPPDILTGPEVQLLHRPGTRFETLTNEEQGTVRSVRRIRHKWLSYPIGLHAPFWVRSLVHVVLM